jgi:hypothetical protein
MRIDIKSCVLGSVLAVGGMMCLAGAGDGQGQPQGHFQLSSFNIPDRNPSYGAYMVDTHSGDVWLIEGQQVSHLDKTPVATPPR